MGRTKHIPRPAPAEPDDQAVAPTGAGTGAEHDAAQGEAEIAEVVAQLPQGAVGSLQRFVEGGEKEWCEHIAAGDFDLDRIREKWGPGRYVIYWRKPDPNKPGRRVPSGSTPLRFGAPASNPGGAPVPGLAPDARASLAIATVAEEHVKRMLDGQQLLQQMQMAVLKNLTEPKQGSELTEKLLLALIAQRQQSAAPDLAALVTLADKLANRTSPTAAMKDTLDLLDKARELAGGGDEGPPWIGVAARALDVIGKAVAARPAVPELAPVPDSILAPAPVPAAAALAPAGPEVPALPATAHALFHFLAPHMPLLLRQAELDHDPTTYAGLIFDQLRPEYLGEVRDYVSRPDFLDLLAGAFPDVQAAFSRPGADPSSGEQVIRAWFTELRDDLVVRIREELEPPSPTPEV